MISKGLFAMHKSFLLLACLMLSLACGKQKINPNVLEINSFVNIPFHQIKFLNEKLGFIVGGERYTKPCMLKTLDGGNTWQEIDLSFADEKKAIYDIAISEQGKIVTCGYGGTIFVSKDTGNTFRYVQHPSWSLLKSLDFTMDDSCILVGGEAFEQGHIDKIRVDGESDKILQEEFKNELCDVVYTKNHVAYISGFGLVLKSEDDGRHWEYTSANNDYFKAMSWINESEGIIVGYQGSIQRTIDGGETWEVIRNGNNFTKKRIHFLDITNNGVGMYVAVGEKGIVYISRNYGGEWHEVKNFTTVTLRSLVFLNQNTCLVVGDGGSIFRINID